MVEKHQLLNGQMQAIPVNANALLVHVPVQFLVLLLVVVVVNNNIGMVNKDHKPSFVSSYCQTFSLLPFSFHHPFEKSFD